MIYDACNKPKADIIYSVHYWNKRFKRSERDFVKLEKALEFAKKLREQAAHEDRAIGIIIWKYKWYADDNDYILQYNGGIEDFEKELQ